MRAPPGPALQQSLTAHNAKFQSRIASDGITLPRPLVTFHYTPTRASWLKRVEGWFSILQGQSLTGASFTSVEQLKERIDAFIERYNENAELFVWTKSKVHQRRVEGRRLSDL
jgi:hypothetical protein